MVDSDNHYYEAEDAFIRYGDADVKAYVRWVSVGRRRYITFGTTMATNLPNPTFDPVAKPGVFHDRLIELEAGSANRALSRMAKQRYGELEPISSAYRDRDARLRVMDEQGVDRCLLFPTLGVGVEGMMRREVEMAYKVFHAFNLWLEEDWGFAYQNRIYAAPTSLCSIPTSRRERSIMSSAAAPASSRCGQDRQTVAPRRIQRGTPSGLVSTRPAFPSRTTPRPDRMTTIWRSSSSGSVRTSPTSSTRTPWQPRCETPVGSSIRCWP